MIFFSNKKQGDVFAIVFCFYDTGEFFPTIECSIEDEFIHQGFIMDETFEGF